MVLRELAKIETILERRRRLFFDKNYIKNKLKKRRGKCKKCGQCCRGCFFLDKKTNLCRTYKRRPFFCYKDFPIDKRDQEAWCVKNCGYSFIKDK